MGDKHKVTNEYLAKLELVSIKIGDITQQARLDEKEKKLYFIDGNGNYTGKYGNYDPQMCETTSTSDNPNEAHVSEKAKDTNEVAPDKTDYDIAIESKIKKDKVAIVKEQDSPKDQPVPEEESGSEAKGILCTISEKTNLPPSRIKQIILGIVCIAIAFVGIKTSIKIQRQTETEIHSPIETKQPIATETISEILPTESSIPIDDDTETIRILAAREAMMPGHCISDRDFTVVKVSMEDYRIMEASGGVFKEEDCVKLRNQFCVDYIAENQYISYAAVASQYSPINPWKDQSKDIQMVTVPVDILIEDLPQYMWGNTVDIKVTVTTKLDIDAVPNASEVQESFPEGIQHESSNAQSIVTDSYTIDSVTIVDLLDENKYSLFKRYYTLSKIPMASKETVLSSIYNQKWDIAKDMPRYIKVVVSEEQAELLNEVVGLKDIEVNISNPVPNVKTDLEEKTYSAIHDLSDVLVRIWLKEDIS